MLATRRGCEDGFTVKKYYSNTEYEVRDNLAHAFLAAGFAVSIENRKVTKNIYKAPPKKFPRTREKVISPNKNSKLDKLTLAIFRNKKNDK
jgi:hypothetical protein